VTAKKAVPSPPPDDDPPFRAPVGSRTMWVLPGWRLLRNGHVFEPGDFVVLPIKQAAEWRAWGSLISLDELAERHPEFADTAQGKHLLKGLRR
jgi:hypothetical protein